MDMRSTGLIALLLALSACATTPVREIPSTGEDSIQVVSWNVHFDTPNTPKELLEEKLGLLREIDADILLLQEVLTIEERRVIEPARFRLLLRRHAPEYGIVTAEGASRIAGANVILYKRDRFVPCRQGIRWFSATPAVPDSTSYGNTIPRAWVWTELYDVNHRRSFTVVNTHLSPSQERANRQCVQDLCTFLQQCEGVVIVGGDFNCHPAGAVYEMMSARYCDATEDLGPTVSPLPLQIDYLFVSPEVTSTYSSALDARSLSDHRPVYAVLHW
jgi:endonuclease/exonuclease/phosphatase family metal-dependent hydrolase